MFKLSVGKKESLKSEVSYQYSRSQGPGGQKVNKTESRAELHWDLLASSLFTSEQKTIISIKLKNRLNKQGVLLFYSEKYRNRLQNKDLCFENLVLSLEKALTKPKNRKKTRPTRSSVEKRINEKKKHGDKKKMRQKVD